MSKLKTATSALTAAALVTGISLAWAQTESQQEITPSTTVVPSTISEQTPADPNAAPLVDNSAAMQQGANTTPPAVDSTSPAPQSSDANSQAPQAPQATISSTPMDNGSTATSSSDNSYNASYEPAPRADRN